MVKFNFVREKTFKEEIHRAGWNWVTKSLINTFHDPKADILMDEFVERTFDWDYTFNNDKALILPHHKQDWIGFIHNPIIIPKPFDIKHPSKEGWRLRYACIEGPEVAVYCRGRVKNKTEILLPNYWKDLVHTNSISVQLQPIGAHQDVIVKRWDDEKIYLQSNGGMPINCFYHVYAERKDINPLITEYEGDSWKDYPDPNFDPEKVNYKDQTFTDPRFAGPPNTITI